MKPKEMLKILKRAGFVKKRQIGSHVQHVSCSEKFEDYCANAQQRPEEEHFKEYFEASWFEDGRLISN